MKQPAVLARKPRDLALQPLTVRNLAEFRYETILEYGAAAKATCEANTVNPVNTTIGIRCSESG